MEWCKHAHPVRHINPNYTLEETDYSVYAIAQFRLSGENVFITPLRLSVCLSIRANVPSSVLSARPSLRQFVNPYDPQQVRKSVRLFVLPPICPSIRHPAIVRPSVRSSVSRLDKPVRPSVRTFIRPSDRSLASPCVPQSTRPLAGPRIRRFIRSSVRSSVCPSVRSFVQLSTCSPIHPFSPPCVHQARSQDFGGEVARIWIPATKGIQGVSVTPGKLKKCSCDLVHYITSVAQKSLIQRT